MPPGRALTTCTPPSVRPDGCALAPKPTKGLQWPAAGWCPVWIDHWYSLRPVSDDADQPTGEDTGAVPCPRAVRMDVRMSQYGRRIERVLVGGYVTCHAGVG